MVQELKCPLPPGLRNRQNHPWKNLFRRLGHCNRTAGYVAEKLKNKEHYICRWDKPRSPWINWLLEAVEVKQGPIQLLQEAFWNEFPTPFPQSWRNTCGSGEREGVSWFSTVSKNLPELLELKVSRSDCFLLVCQTQTLQDNIQSCQIQHSQRVKRCTLNGLGRNVNKLFTCALEKTPPVGVWLTTKWIINLLPANVFFCPCSESAILTNYRLDRNSTTLNKILIPEYLCHWNDF